MKTAKEKWFEETAQFPPTIGIEMAFDAGYKAGLLRAAEIAVEYQNGLAVQTMCTNTVAAVANAIEQEANPHHDQETTT